MQSLAMIVPQCKTVPQCKIWSTRDPKVTEPFRRAFLGIIPSRISVTDYSWRELFRKLFTMRK